MEIVRSLGIIAIAIVLTNALYTVKEECPTNEEYLLCGTSCPLNCSNPEGPVSCSDDCVEGCFCKGGYLRNDNGTCVATDQCGDKNNTICGDNEEFVSCDFACSATCSKPDAVCGLSCSMGCFCKSGYVRDEASNKCVTLDQCPEYQCLKLNEVYSRCYGACQPSCADPDVICNKMCAEGCVCAPGFIRNNDSECISIDKCENATISTLVDRILDDFSDSDTQ